jgi:hypothetical protein
VARLLGLAFALLLSACATFRSQPLAGLDAARVIDKQHPLPAISYEGSGWPCFSTELLFRSAFVDARKGPAQDDLHVVLRFEHKVEDQTLSRVSYILSTLTLTLLPGFYPDDFSLAALVEGPGREAREYVYRESATTWIQILLLFAAWWHDPGEVQRSVQENMLLHFLVELRRDLGSRP